MAVRARAITRWPERFLRCCGILARKLAPRAYRSARAKRQLQGETRAEGIAAAEPDSLSDTARYHPRVARTRLGGRVDRRKYSVQCLSQPAKALQLARDGYRRRRVRFRHYHIHAHRSWRARSEV